jgi:protein-disulfide isomerase
MNKTIGWVLATVAVIAAAALIFVVPKLGNEDNSAGRPAQRQTGGAGKQPGGTQLIIGEADAPKTITEYGDYKCPNCTRFHTGSYTQLKQDYLHSGKAKLVFRNLPYIAEDSRTAAEGSYCANEQGLFEQYHEAVYDYIANIYDTEGQSREFDNILTADVLSGIVSGAGGEKQQFSNCLQETKYANQVDEDLRASEDDGASGTPTFIVAGQKIVGAQPISTFRTLLEAN